MEQELKLENMSSKELLEMASTLINNAKETAMEFNYDELDSDRLCGLAEMTDEESVVAGFLGSMAMVGLKAADPGTLSKLTPVVLELVTRDQWFEETKETEEA